MVSTVCDIFLLTVCNIDWGSLFDSSARAVVEAYLSSDVVKIEKFVQDYRAIAISISTNRLNSAMIYQLYVIALLSYEFSATKNIYLVHLDFGGCACHNTIAIIYG